jgi:sugar/nucleoside kinase (ribokinase family)
MRQLAVIGHLSRDVVADGSPQIGGGPWHAARALHALRHDALLLAKCGDAERREYQLRLATLGLPSQVVGRGATTGFAFSYGDDGVRTMEVTVEGEPWRVDDVPETLLRRAEWVHVAPLLRGDFDAEMLAHLARGRRLLLDGQGLVRAREVGPLRLDADFDREMLRHVTVLKLAVEEAEVLGDLQALGVPEILVTDGPRGARIVTRDGDVHVPARYVAADPTGAGDAFAVTYVAARADGHAPVSAARRATALVAALLSQGRR